MKKRSIAGRETKKCTYCMSKHTAYRLTKNKSSPYRNLHFPDRLWYVVEAGLIQGFFQVQVFEELRILLDIFFFADVV